VLAVVLNAQLLFDGAVIGLSYGMLAAGLVLIFRSSGIVNFAYAEVGAFSVSLLSLLVLQWHWPYLVAAPVCVAVGTLLSAVIELTVVRRLYDAPRVIVLIATVGVAQILLVMGLALPDLDGFHRYPMLFQGTWDVGPLLVRSDQLLAILLIPTAVGALGWFLARTFVGTAIRGAAANTEAARLMGINAKHLSTVVWALAGALSALAALVERPLSGVAVTVGTPSLDARLLVLALAAALVARFRSLPIALAAGVGIGLVERILLVNRPSEPGMVTGVALLVILAMSLRVAGAGEERRTRWSFASQRVPIDPRVQERWLGRHLGHVGLAISGVAAIALPVVVSTPSRQLLYAEVLVFAILALSVTVLTGWAGQVSLGQFAFAGVGAFVTAAAMRAGATFGLATVSAAVAVTLVAVLVGLPSLRVRGLVLAVATLAFAVFTSSYLLGTELLSGGGSSIRIPRTVENGLDLGSQRTYYWLCLAVLALLALVLGRVRRRGVGRRFIAVRENETAAAAMTVSPARAKLVAFGMGGTVAGLAGALYGGLLGRLDQFSFPPEVSIQIVAVAVIGGLGSVVGAVLGALWVVGLPVLLGGSPEVTLVTSGAGLLILLMYFPGGLVQLVETGRGALLQRLARDLPPEPPRERPVIAVAAGRERDAVAPGAIALRAEALTVRFGGNVAVDGMSLELRAGEIVGLIGANGAGKTTLMNAIGGFVPASGQVWLFDHELTGRSPAERARLGLGRAFQNAELFAELTVRETVQVALERRLPTSLLGTVLGTRGAARRERQQRAEADELIDFLGLGRYADAMVGNLSTGTRRITELSCLLALDARVVCLDEPTAGVAQRETEAFGPLLREIRAEFDSSMLIIEHDMPLVLSVSDRVYCMELGREIAQGSPDAVREDPAVIASYLGTDDRAILRSGPR
jgi:ABC-type branched-subunit amino acid transport system ATPase component/ABC-type branched-subunit amino acid transport system permease subunit